jgi:hypothetical protein
VILRGLPIPWWRLATAALLSVALAISADAGRLIESIIIAVLLVPLLAFLGIWIIAFRRGLIGKTATISSAPTSCSVGREGLGLGQSR